MNTLSRLLAGFQFPIFYAFNFFLIQFTKFIEFFQALAEEHKKSCDNTGNSIIIIFHLQVYLDQIFKPAFFPLLFVDVLSNGFKLDVK